MDLLRRGGVNRAIRATKHNEASSRSHAILQMHVELETTTTTTTTTTAAAATAAADAPGAGGDASAESATTKTTATTAVSVIRRAKLNLVDLAGSEKCVRLHARAGQRKL